MVRVRPRTWLLLIGAFALVVVVIVGIKLWLDRQTPSLPLTVEGLPVMSVSAVLEARAAGGLRSQPVAVGGYWSGVVIGHSCVPPDVEPGELEIRCHDGEFGITEFNEPVMTLHQGGRVTTAIGPHLTPFASNDVAEQLFSLRPVFGQPYPPVPIIVIGHFDDPRAAACRPEARQICLDRLVIDRVVHFDPTAVVLPGPTLGPTPFASGEEPPPLFGAADCAGDVEYSFAGWTTPAELGFDRGAANEHLFAMITAEAIPLGDWSGPYGAKARLWGRQICFRWIWEGAGSGSMSFELVPGTTFKELQDGSHVPWSP